MSLATIEKEALALEPLERAKLLDRLFESLAMDDEQSSRFAAWNAEAESRAAAIAKGELQTFDESEVMAGVRNRLSR